MGLSEFNLIDHYFRCAGAQRDDVCLGVGDDAALLTSPPDQVLVMSMDTLVEGIHFPKQTPAQDIAYKALAVNLSDMAAMGAEPAWMLLALTLPQVDEPWLQAFSEGLSGLAAEYGVALVGGDTTRGVLTISVQITGFVPQGQALRRDGARTGDLIFVTGQLGDAGLGLQLKLNKNISSISEARKDYFVNRLQRPMPRVSTAMALRGIASAAIDISDGLAADLGHILKASGLGASLEVEGLPVAAEIKALQQAWWQLPLSAGDDYELCFTVSPDKEAEMYAALNRIDCPVTCIGRIEEQPGLRLCKADGELVSMNVQGYQHFV